ncbi:hypothetical protein Tco_0964480 [Tanacetum coccineum]
MSGGPSTTPKGKKVKAEGKEKSEWWQYYEVLYEKDEDGNRRKIAKCKYCETRLVADNELESKVEDMVEEVKTKIGELFETYKERFDFLSSNSSMGKHMESEVTSPNNGDNDFLNDYYNVDATSSYETETDILAIQISTVASEAAFSTDDLVVECSPRAVLFFPSPMFFPPGFTWEGFLRKQYRLAYFSHMVLLLRGVCGTLCTLRWVFPIGVIVSVSWF